MGEAAWCSAFDVAVHLKPLPPGVKVRRPAAEVIDEGIRTLARVLR
jgi:hypothetical protein